MVWKTATCLWNTEMDGWLLLRYLADSRSCACSVTAKILSDPQIFLSFILT